MPNSKETIEFFDAAAKILLRCFLMAYLLLLAWVGIIVLAPSVIHSFDKLFGLTADQTNVINYCAIVFVKSCVLLFFVIPYIAIRLVLRKRLG